MITGAAAKTLTLAVSGPTAKSADLQISGPDSSTDSLNLRVAAEPVYPLTLFIGNAKYNENLNLYVNTPISETTSGYTLFGNINTMSVSGGLNSGVYQNIDFSIAGPTFGAASAGASDFAENAAISLQIKTPPPVALTQTSPLSINAENQGTIPLFIPCENTASGDMTLYIQRDFANSLDMSIKSVIGSGTQDLAISGVYMENNNLNLAILSTYASGMNLITDGYRE